MKSKKQETCKHESKKLVGELSCKDQPYCCDGEGDGHWCSREHSFTLIEICTKCSKELRRGEEVEDLDSLINAVVESVS